MLNLMKTVCTVREEMLFAVLFSTTVHSQFVFLVYDLVH